MKIGIAQINTIVGDLKGNRLKITESYRLLCQKGAELVLFPELAVCGYPPRDLLGKSRFVPDNEASLQEIAAQTGEPPLLVGFVEQNNSGQGRDFYNAAAWCAHGEVQRTFRKCLLPAYDVFDEERHFHGADNPQFMEYGGKRIGITICEDIWTAPFVDTRQRYRFDPVEVLSGADLDLLLNLSASPWQFGKNDFRQDLVSSAASRCRCPMVFCNAIGGNDELIFDGHSIAVNAEGKLIAGLAGFREESLVIDIQSDSRQEILSPSFRQEPMADIHDALLLGLRDYAHKSGFHKALLGLSGGIDSAVTAALAADALGKENVIGISLPSAISSSHSRDDAAALAANLGIEYHTLGISELVSAADKTLKPLFEGRSEDVTEENVQARSRGLLLMAVSNKFGALLLSTGNKSELAVGYCTLYGDMCGGLAVISDLPKVKVYQLARWINRHREIIPANTIDKAPSAELRPDQKDEDSLPPYEVLDAILALYVEEGKSSSEIIEAGFAPEIVHDIIRKVDLNEYKRKQAAPGLKITPLAFGVGRRIPIVQKYVG